MFAALTETELRSLHKKSVEAIIRESRVATDEYLHAMTNHPSGFSDAEELWIETRKELNRRDAETREITFFGCDGWTTETVEI